MKYIVKRFNSQALELLSGQRPNAEMFEQIIDCPIEVENPNDCDIIQPVDPITGLPMIQPITELPVYVVVFNETKRTARLATELAVKEAFETAYTTLRQRAYPSLAEQMDMQYWDKINGTNNWETLITNIKNQFPKI